MLWEESGFKNRKRSRPSALAPTSPPPSEQLTHVCLTHCIRISHQISFELGLPCEKKTTWRIFKFKSRNLSDSPARLSNRGGTCAGTTFNRLLLEEERIKKTPPRELEVDQNSAIEGLFHGLSHQQGCSSLSFL